MPRAAAAFWTLFVVILFFPSALVTSGAGFLVVLLHRLADRVVYIVPRLLYATIIAPRPVFVNIFLGIF